MPATMSVIKNPAMQVNAQFINFRNRISYAPLKAAKPLAPMAVSMLGVRTALFVQHNENTNLN
jgi:hypothetical protein